MAKPIEGIITAVVTPFDEDEKVDKKAFRRIIDYLIENGIHGLFPIGSQGEFYALTDQEKRELIDLAVEQVRGRVFVMPNTGCLTTRESIELSRYAERVGADCVSVITPFFISPSQEELYGHYAAICESVSIPVLAYNNPDRTGGVRLTPATLARLARSCPNFQGIKDSTGDLTLVAEMIRQTPPGFKVIMGRDTLIYGGLMYGTAGAVAATANVAPRLAVGIWEAFRKKDYARALDCQRRLAPVRMAFGLGSFPVVVKEALNMMGLPAGRCRRPIQPLAGDKRAELRRVLTELGLV